MAQAFKALYTIRECKIHKRQTMLINALILSHLHYLALMLATIAQNLIITVAKQLSWAVKACWAVRNLSPLRSLKQKLAYYQ